MEDGNLHLALEPLLDLEAGRRGDVFEIDSTEGRLQHLHRPDELLGVPRVDLQIEHVDIREAFEEDRFAFHDRLAGRRPDRAKAEHRRAVGDHGDEIALGRVFVDLSGLASDLQTRFGHTGRVGQSQIALRRGRLGGNDFDLSRAAAGVVFESVVAFRHRRGL